MDFDNSSVSNKLSLTTGRTPELNCIDNKSFEELNDSITKYYGHLFEDC